MIPYPKLIEPIAENRHSLRNGDFLLPEMLYAAKNNSADKSSGIGRGVSAADSFYSAVHYIFASSQKQMPQFQHSALNPLTR